MSENTVLIIIALSVVAGVILFISVSIWIDHRREKRREDMINFIFHEDKKND
jgi:hypothetical protein